MLVTQDYKKAHSLCGDRFQLPAQPPEQAGEKSITQHAEAFLFPSCVQFSQQGSAQRLSGLRRNVLKDDRTCADSDILGAGQKRLMFWVNIHERNRLKKITSVAADVACAVVGCLIIMSGPILAAAGLLNG